MVNDPRRDEHETPSLAAGLRADAVAEAKRWWIWAKRGGIVGGVLGGAAGFVLLSWEGLLYGGGGGAAVGAVVTWFLYLQISSDL